jgi:hypothetical protein
MLVGQAVRISDHPLPGRKTAIIGLLGILCACGTSSHTPGLHGVRGEVNCQDNMVLVCDHTTRIKNAERNCICQPDRQVLNMTIEP